MLQLAKQSIIQSATTRPPLYPLTPRHPVTSRHLLVNLHPRLLHLAPVVSAWSSTSTRSTAPTAAEASSPSPPPLTSPSLLALPLSRRCSGLKSKGARRIRALATSQPFSPSPPPPTMSPLPSVLVIGGNHLPKVLSDLSSFASLLPLPPPGAERDALIQTSGADVRGVATGSFWGFPTELFEKLPKLEIISNFGVGVDSIDVAEAKRRGIAVTNTPDVLTDDVADLALGLILATSRRLGESERYVRSGEWKAKGMMHLTRKVTGKRVGIIGLGRIGLAIAKRAAAFDCKILYHNRRPKEGVAFEYFPTVVELAANSDFLVVACPLTPETTKIVDEQVLKALGPEGVLINIARGRNVDEAALVRALEQGLIGGAGLDVFEDEPNVPEALLGRDDVVLLPHVGSATVETRGEMGDLMVANLRAHFKGEPLITPL